MSLFDKHCEKCGRWVLRPFEFRGQKICILCRQDIQDEERGVKKSHVNESSTERIQNLSKLLNPIKETKVTCLACHEVYFYNQSDKINNFADKMDAAGDELIKTSCCCLFFPLGLFTTMIPKKKVEDLDRCRKCGSRAIKKEIVVHNTDN